MNDKPCQPVIARGSARTRRLAAGSKLALRNDLPGRKTPRIDLGVLYSNDGSGDEIVGVQPKTAFYPFHPDAKSKN
ncbi:MAG TPA: hypothetical protein VGE01_10945 [Fimbriimonas sp.]